MTIDEDIIMNQPTDHLIYEYTIRNTETDVDDRLQLHTLFSMLQEAAALNAEVYGWGAEQLDPVNLSWLLLRVSVRMEKMPSWRDKIGVETWSRGSDRLYFFRDFIIRDADQNILGYASSVWIVVDKTHHRPIRPTQLTQMAKTLSDPARVFPEDPPKLAPVSDLLSKESQLIKFADFSEIDRNHHVNNTRYVAWCLDAYHKDSSLHDIVTGIDINYFSEIKFGSKVHLYCSVSDGKTQIDGLVESSEKPAFSAVLYTSTKE